MKTWPKISGDKHTHVYFLLFSGFCFKKQSKGELLLVPDMWSFNLT